MKTVRQLYCRFSHIFNHNRNRPCDRFVAGIWVLIAGFFRYRFRYRRLAGDSFALPAWLHPLSSSTYHLLQLPSLVFRAAVRSRIGGFSTAQVWAHLKRVFCLSLFGLASLAIAADAQWPITVPELVRDELVAVTLPTALFANGQADATTLRVRGNQGGEIPVRYEPLQTVIHARRRISTAPFAMVAAEMPDGALRLTLRRPMPPAPAPAVDPIEGLTIRTPLRDFEQQVSVEFSNDGVNWTVFVEQAPLFDFSRHADVRRTEIVFPSGLTNQHLRLTFEQAMDVREQLTALITATQSEVLGATESRAVHVDTRPFNVETVSGWTSSRIEASRKPVQADYPITWTALTNGVPRGKTRYTIEAQGQPLTHVAITIPGDYASWPYTLTCDSLTATRLLAQGVLKQFRFRGSTDASTTINFSEIRAQRYVLTFDHPHADITAITASGPSYRFVFPARPLHRYTLLQLLEPDMRLPDATQIIALLGRDVQPVEGSLEATPRPAEARGTGYAWLRRHFFHIGIGVALLALAFSLSRAMRRL